MRAWYGRRTYATRSPGPTSENESLELDTFDPHTDIRELDPTRYFSLVYLFVGGIAEGISACHIDGSTYWESPPYDGVGERLYRTI